MNRSLFSIPVGFLAMFVTATGIAIGMRSFVAPMFLAFVAVAEAGTFTAAAQRLSLTTNAVSLRIQKLEQTLHVRLFVRTTRSVALTDEGERFLARIAPLLTAIEVAQEEVRGTVRIAIPGAAATAPFLDRLNVLFNRHPGLVVQLRVGSAASDLAAEGLDIALHVGQVQETTFVGRRLGAVTWVLAASPTYLAKFGSRKCRRTSASIAA